MIRIVIADDHDIVRSGLKMLLESDPDMCVVGEAADGEQAFQIAMREKPDILLMDISMPPGQSGLIACGRVTKNLPKTRVIVVTMFAEPEYLFFTLRGGASGYLLKNSSREDLLNAVRTVHAGGSFIHPKMVEGITRQLVSSGDGVEDTSYKQLTTRELEILQLLAKGHTNKEISEKIYLSIKTVEAHRSKIYAKLSFKTRADLVAYAIRHKLLDL